MTICALFHTLVIPIENINRVYEGGFKQYLLDNIATKQWKRLHWLNKASVINDYEEYHDGILFKTWWKTTEELENEIKKWEALGLERTITQDGIKKWKDLCVISHLGVYKYPCDWIKFIDGDNDSTICTYCAYPNKATKPAKFPSYQGHDFYATEYIWELCQKLLNEENYKLYAKIKAVQTNLVNNAINNNKKPNYNKAISNFIELEQEAQKTIHTQASSAEQNLLKIMALSWRTQQSLLLEPFLAENVTYWTFYREAFITHLTKNEFINLWQEMFVNARTDYSGETFGMTKRPIALTSRYSLYTQKPYIKIYRTEAQTKIIEGISIELNNANLITDIVKANISYFE